MRIPSSTYAAYLYDGLTASIASIAKKPTNIAKSIALRDRRVRTTSFSMILSMVAGATCAKDDNRGISRAYYSRTLRSKKISSGLALILTSIGSCVPVSNHRFAPPRQLLTLLRIGRASFTLDGLNTFLPPQGDELHSDHMSEHSELEGQPTRSDCRREGRPGQQ